jgi:hypothetical protein
MTDDHVRMYMDWDSQVCCLFVWVFFVVVFRRPAPTISFSFVLVGVFWQEWKPFPDMWYPAAHRATEMSLSGLNAGDEEAEPVDPRVGEYLHPRRGVFPTYLFENSRNTRLYFDESIGQWARMPLSWERNVPEIKVPPWFF